MLTSAALCVVTFRRPIGLRATLEGLAHQDVNPEDVQCRLVVVDNDESGSARSVVDTFAGTAPFPVCYATEPHRGIPIARNRAVDLAGDVDLILWIDDDEVPAPDWLSTLLRVMTQRDADVAIGPSVPRLPSTAPSWIQEGGFFERSRFATGSIIPANYARTSGVAVRRSAMPKRAQAFLEDLRFTGGSDREHFVTMEQQGAVFVWVDEAVVTELVPETRARATWIMMRAFRIGNSRSTTTLLAPTSLSKRVRLIGIGVRKLILGLTRALLSAPRGRAASMRGVWQACYGAGLASGALSFRFQEYRRHHGS